MFYRHVDAKLGGQVICRNKWTTNKFSQTNELLEKWAIRLLFPIIDQIMFCRNN